MKRKYARKSWSQNMSFGTGVAAALSAPFVMTIGFIVWENCWKGSSFCLNLFKCNLASIGFLILSLTTRQGDLFPSTIFTTTSVGYLMLSATIGILIGDWMWLEGLKIIGARRVIVIDSIKPFLAALFGWAILGEALRPPAFGGMALTVTGVVIVSLEKEKVIPDLDGGGDEMTEKNESEDETRRASALTERTQQESMEIGQSTHMKNGNEQVLNSSHDAAESEGGADERVKENPSDLNSEKSTNATNRCTSEASIHRRGYAMAFLNVVFDTYGSLLTKQHGVGMTTWEINLIRFGFAGACMLGLFAVLQLRDWIIQKHERRRKGRDDSVEGSNDDDVAPASDVVKSNEETWYSFPTTMTRTAWVWVTLGVGLVTFLTPALSNYALFQIALALAITLGSVGPLYSLPLTWIMQHDRPSIAACVGATLSVAGIVVLSLFGKEQ